MDFQKYFQKSKIRFETKSVKSPSGTAHYLPNYGECGRFLDDGLQTKELIFGWVVKLSEDISFFGGEEAEKEKFHIKVNRFVAAYELMRTAVEFRPELFKRGTIESTLLSDLFEVGFNMALKQDPIILAGNEKFGPRSSFEFPWIGKKDVWLNRIVDRRLIPPVCLFSLEEIFEKSEIFSEQIDSILDYNLNRKSDSLKTIIPTLKSALNDKELEIDPRKRQLGNNLVKWFELGESIESESRLAQNAPISFNFENFPSSGAQLKKNDELLVRELELFSNSEFFGRNTKLANKTIHFIQGLGVLRYYTRYGKGYIVEKIIKAEGGREICKLSEKYKHYFCDFNIQMPYRSVKKDSDLNVFEEGSGIIIYQKRHSEWGIDDIRKISASVNQGAQQLFGIFNLVPVPKEVERRKTVG